MKGDFAPRGCAGIPETPVGLRYAAAALRPRDACAAAGGKKKE